MNRIEAAEFLEICRRWFEPYTSAKNKWHKALDLAIEALEQESKIVIPVKEK